MLHSDIINNITVVKKIKTLKYKIAAEIVHIKTKPKHFKTVFELQTSNLEKL